MPLMSGLRKFSWTLNDPARTAVSCMSVEAQRAVADGVPVTGLVLPGVGLVAVHPLHPGAGAAEVPAVVAEVHRGVAPARHDSPLRRRDEVLPRQVGAGVLE